MRREKKLTQAEQDCLFTKQIARDVICIKK